jgi:hypothetical protein
MAIYKGKIIGITLENMVKEFNHTLSMISEEEWKHPGTHTAKVLKQTAIEMQKEINDSLKFCKDAK